MLGGPSPLGPGAVVVGPDDLVEEALAAEDLIEQELAVVRLAIVDVEVEAAVLAQQAVRLEQPWLEEGQVVVEAIAVAGLREERRFVAATLKARALPLPVLHRLERAAGLQLAGVERRVDVDQLKGPALQRGQQLEVLTQQYPIGPGMLAFSRHRAEANRGRRSDSGASAGHRVALPNLRPSARSRSSETLPVASGRRAGFKSRSMESDELSYMPSATQTTPSPPVPSASPSRGRWIDHWLDTVGDLEALRAGHPMMDAVIEEIDGRMIRVGDRWLADFASCNYLGFDLDPEIIGAVPEYLERWGTHPSWSRLLGSPALYEQIETRLTALLGCEDTLVLPTITHIHASVIPVLAASGTIFLDTRAHKTIYDGCQVARSRGSAVRRFRFEDPDHLDELLRDDHDRARLVCMDGVNSMTGNAPDLHEFAAVARRHGALLYVDDAHGFGVIGERSPDERCPYGLRGNSIVRHADESYEDIVLVGGFSKAYSSLLAFIACPTEVKNLLKVAAPPYLYSGPSPVASLATVLAGFDVNERRGDDLRGHPAPSHRPRAGDAARARRPHAEPLRAADHRDPAARPRAHRLGRTDAVRARRLRHPRGLSARAQGRGRLPGAADRARTPTPRSTP